MGVSNTGCEDEGQRDNADWPLQDQVQKSRVGLCDIHEAASRAADRNRGEPEERLARRDTPRPRRPGRPAALPGVLARGPAPADRLHLRVTLHPPRHTQAEPNSHAQLPVPPHAPGALDFKS